MAFSRSVFIAFDFAPAPALAPLALCALGLAAAASLFHFSTVFSASSRDEPSGASSWAGASFGLHERRCTASRSLPENVRPQ